MADPYYMSTHTDPEDGDPTALAQLEANAAIMENEDESWASTILRTGKWSNPNKGELDD